MKRIHETREVTGFRRLELYDNANCVTLIVEPGAPEQLIIEGPPETVARIDSEVRGETLRVALTGDLVDKLKDALTLSPGRKRITYRLTAKNLAEIKLVGLIQLDLSAYGAERPRLVERFPPLLMGVCLENS